MKNGHHIPFNLFPQDFLESKSKIFLHWSDELMPFFPDLDKTLLQTRMTINPNAYVSVALFLSSFYFIFFSLLFVAGGFFFNQLSWFSFLVPIIITFFVFLSVIFYPKVQTKKRMKQIDANLIPAMRHLLIQIKSGVTLFEGMHGISSDYGEVSAVFSKAVSEITTGRKETEVLSEMSELNPSFAFRRVIWQLNNALRSGSDLGDALETVINDLTKEQITAIKKYGQELNPWTMIYMVMAVIFPSLGITFLVIITSFTGITIPIIIYPTILGALIGFQLFFMNFVKEKRPAI